MNFFENPSQNFESKHSAFEMLDSYAQSRKPFVEFSADHSIASIKKSSEVMINPDLEKMMREIEELGFALDRKTLEKGDYVVFERSEEMEKENELPLAA